MIIKINNFTFITTEQSFNCEVKISSDDKKKTIFLQYSEERKPTLGSFNTKINYWNVGLTLDKANPVEHILDAIKKKYNNQSQEWLKVTLLDTINKYCECQLINNWRVSHAFTHTMEHKQFLPFFDAYFELGALSLGIDVVSLRRLIIQKLRKETAIPAINQHNIDYNIFNYHPVTRGLYQWLYYDFRPFIGR